VRENERALLVQSCVCTYVTGSITLSSRWDCPAKQHEPWPSALLAGADIQADFEDTPMLGQKQWREELQYDAITCMFAIHYFFESEKAIKTFMHNVSINLREGSLNTAQLHLNGSASILSYCLALACLHKMRLHSFHFGSTCLALAVCC
jgi:hypothetical protein